MEGRDGSFFGIDSGGVLAFLKPPNYEDGVDPDGNSVGADADGNNVYEVEIEAGDGVESDSLAVTVTVREVNEGPVITGTASVTVEENYGIAQILESYTAEDPEDPSAMITRWSLSGSDAGDFTITEKGELSFRNVPDYDKPADSGKDNVYNFSVRASDGRKYGYLPVVVTVTGVNEAPTITTTSTSATALRQDENRTSRLYTYRATDPEGDTITWTVEGRDGSFFAIDDRGQFSFSESTPPDFEQPGDLGWQQRLRGGDPGRRWGDTDSLAVTVTVREVNEGPEVTGTATSRHCGEPEPPGLAAFSARDPEDPDGHDHPLEPQRLGRRRLHDYGHQRADGAKHG